MKIYQQLAHLILARRNCEKNKNTEWYAIHAARIEAMMQCAPSGSGFNNGVTLDERSSPEKLVFHFGFHHMNEDGFYEGWTHHDVWVKGSLPFGFRVHISKGHELVEPSIGGCDVQRRDCPVSDDNLDYFYDVFHEWLDEEFIPPAGW